ALRRRKARRHRRRARLSLRESAGLEAPGEGRSRQERRRAEEEDREDRGRAEALGPRRRSAQPAREIRPLARGGSALKKSFSYEDAAALLPEVQRLAQEAVDQVDALPENAQRDQQRVVERWAESVMGLGIDVKGVWLVDFDNGSGYYCWQYPEESL